MFLSKIKLRAETLDHQFAARRPKMIIRSAGMYPRTTTPTRHFAPALRFRFGSQHPPTPPNADPTPHQAPDRTTACGAVDGTAYVRSRTGPAEAGRVTRCDSAQLDADVTRPIRARRINAIRATKRDEHGSKQAKRGGAAPTAACGAGAAFPKRSGAIWHSPNVVGAALREAISAVRRGPT
ncbi:hypothetical protein Ais01nite_52450 [Asanoa ishikariensis]|nr:hypothetical protein Ais01nite_52450 [Asanoa ishikariensis]